MRSPERATTREGEGWGPVVTHNLDMMRTAMNKAMGGESMGGNAGSVTIDGRKCQCIAVNGYADPETGRIVAFGNVQDINPDVIKGKTPFTFRIAVAFPQPDARGFLRIVEYGTLENLLEEERPLPQVVDAALGASVQRYNAVA